MDVLELIDELGDVIDNARPGRFSDKVRVDRQALSDILEQLRTTLPEPIEQARRIAQERKEMLIEAGREAERIGKDAHERQKRLIADDPITQQAERAAAEIIATARRREREIRLASEDYVEEILSALEVNLTKCIATVQRARERLTGKNPPVEIDQLPLSS